MDISMNTSSALASNANDAVGLTVLKKAMDVEAQGAQMLLQSLPQPQTAFNLPPHLGQNINVTA